ncbi:MULTISPECIES: XRE family transcriptional regulator [Haematospirillum]|uniref:XRE family transcriptional regulator n=1 Tax=Haematospirillum TaxID=1804663 RepID=UPI0014333342|nr:MULTISPECIES: helix-turn-helix domain-containing protein [Haematospirillum]NKD45006.1 helix-turn-helix domain-containing protein [Haematospirillum jordaniae]NKD55150.1 helix-turn-helix domain-containing protein [Haematospirillum sp. H4890]NKD75403.1 helix-turn-helix domain-containing protein [Haematospirillum sp. H4485]NKD81609.1 helix-turn-helix domain-containing protein [Haematospirillum jordaniae]NKD84392.1 helix-turn-helix domain-containing protein [Haematospirillum jordaniae]
MSIGATIQRLRRSRGITQKQIGDALGLSVTSICRIENGDDHLLSIVRIRQFAAALGVSESELTGISDTNGAGPPPVAIHGQSSAQAVVINGFSDMDLPLILHPEYLRTITRRPLVSLRVVTIDSDDMEPTLRPGDQILIDTRDIRPDRPGLLFFCTSAFKGVRRISTTFSGEFVHIKPDNPAYGDGERVESSSISAVGRVIWVGKKI